MSGTFLVSREVRVAADTSTTTIDPTDATLAIANNLRVASLSIAAYDYLVTLPAEIRLYKSSSRRSLGFILFILIRYTSMIIMFTSNFGFFYHGFTPNACSHYFYVLPVFKVIQLMVSQAILGIRTYNVAQRNIRIGRIIASAYFVTSVFLWVTALYDRQERALKFSDYVSDQGNCLIGSAHPDQTISAWSFYLIAMLYDVLVLSVSTYRLLKLRGNSASSPSRRLLNILLYDGLGFFVALTAVNLANVIIYRGVGGAIQSSAASLEYAVIWISSQRILIHLRQEMAQQASLITARSPRANPILSGAHLHNPPYMNKSDENVTVDFGNIYDTGSLSDFNVGVHMKRMITRDTRPQVEESEASTATAGRNLYPPRMSVQVWDGHQEKAFQVMRASDNLASDEKDYV
ncbi:hypothetical protein BGY98DRAFT_1097120 [Russula aff. rugulosa BPL654]|nr:hypothetical protein BGY98DRAFT_1097120 [Russula aff. rugulosa BPL654]